MDCHVHSRISKNVWFLRMVDSCCLAERGNLRGMDCGRFHASNTQRRENTRCKLGCHGYPGRRRGLNSFIKVGWDKGSFTNYLCIHVTLYREIYVDNVSIRQFLLFICG